jgi:hypothetical protein
MLNMAKQRVFIALLLMAVMFFGAVAAEARDTKGADRLVKGAVIGAAVGAATQAVRGRRTGKELVKGAAVGAAAGAAVGAYSDYRQEKNAREDAEREADFYRYGGNRGRYYDDYDRWGRAPRPAANRGGHRHNGRCHHRR